MIRSIEDLVLFDELMCWDPPARAVKNRLKSLGIYKDKWGFVKLAHTSTSSRPKRGIKPIYSYTKDGVKYYQHAVDKRAYEHLRQLGTWKESRYHEPRVRKRAPRARPPVGRLSDFGRGRKTYICGYEIPRVKVETPLGPVYAPDEQEAVKVLDNPVLPRVGTFTVHEDSGQVILDYKGGKAFVLPLKHHKKYWYFLRKNGRYHFSEHHPYGDEHKLLKLRTLQQGLRVYNPLSELFAELT